MHVLSLTNKSTRKRTGKYDTLSVILIGVGRIIACHCFLWNAGYGVGVTPFYLINIFWSIGVICMSLCLAEMASALPFTGGVYGFARGLIGPYVGFLVGIFEFFGNLTLLGVFVIAFGQCVSTSLGLHDLNILPFILIPSGIAVTLQYAGAKRFGFVVKYLTIFCLLLFIIYVFGSLAHISVPRYGNNPNARPPSATYKLRQVFQNSNYGTVFFVGIESLPVISSEAQQPHVSIPWSILVVFIFYCISSTAVIFLAAWQNPGTQDVQRSFVPLSYGYGNIFGISNEAAAIFSAPAALTSCVVCTYYMCVTLRSMAQSGVLPSCVANMARFRSLFCSWRLKSASLPSSSEQKVTDVVETVVEDVIAKQTVDDTLTTFIVASNATTPKTVGSVAVVEKDNEKAVEKKREKVEEEDDEEVPYVALGIVIAGTAITTVMLLAGLLYYEAFALGVLIYGTYCVYSLYAAIFATYLVFYFHYKDKSKQAEHFQSPLGPYGAYIGLFMTCCLVVANNYPYHPYLRNCLVIFVGSFLVFTMVYIRVMANHQRYSPEEEKIFFVAYIIRANRRHRESLRKGSHHNHHHHSNNNNSVSLNNPRKVSSPKSSSSWSKYSISIILRSSSNTNTSTGSNNSSSSGDSSSIRTKLFDFGVIQLTKFHPQWSNKHPSTIDHEMNNNNRRKKASKSNKKFVESSESIVRLKIVPSVPSNLALAHIKETNSSNNNNTSGWLFSLFLTKSTAKPNAKRWLFGDYRHSSATVVAHNTTCDLEAGRGLTNNNIDNNDIHFCTTAIYKQDHVVPFEA